MAWRKRYRRLEEKLRRETTPPPKNPELELLQKEMVACIQSGAPAHELGLLLDRGAHVVSPPPPPEPSDVSTAQIIDEPIGRRGTLLHHAIYERHYEAAQLLLARNCNVNAVDRWDYSPLHLASQCGYAEMVGLLLTHSATVSFTSEITGKTPLHLAIQKQHLDIARMLLQYGAKVSNKTLHLAMESGNFDIISLLIKHGAKVYYDEHDTIENPLFVAIKYRYPKLVELLVQSGANINHCRSAKKGSPLHMACAVGYEHIYEILQVLLQAGADPNRRLYNIWRLRPVLVDYLTNNVEPSLDVVILLRKYGATLNMKDDGDVDGALDALRENCEEILPQLLEISDVFDICVIRQKCEVSTPWSLKRQARLFLWRFTGGGSLTDSIERLNLPKCLERYLLFDYC